MPSASCIARPARNRVHRIPHPTSVTIAIRPSCGHEMARGYRDDLPDEQNGIFFARGLDSQSAAQFVDLPVGHQFAGQTGACAAKPAYERCRCAGWVEPFAKPINVATGNRWVSLTLHPSYELTNKAARCDIRSRSTAASPHRCRMRGNRFKRDLVPRMLRNAPHLRRSALQIRGPSFHLRKSLGPGSAVHRVERCTASGTRAAPTSPPPSARIPRNPSPAAPCAWRTRWPWRSPRCRREYGPRSPA